MPGTIMWPKRVTVLGTKKVVSAYMVAGSASEGLCKTITLEHINRWIVRTGRLRY